MQNRCHHIYTSNDLDGAISLLVYMWSKPPTDSIHYTPISNFNINRLKNDIKNVHNHSQYTVLGIPLDDTLLPELNTPDVTFIDHHKSSEKHLEKFTDSKIIYKEYLSNSLFMYKLMKDNLTINKNQKLLIALSNDYYSSTFSLEDAENLNIIFWTEYQNRFSDFIKDYYDGFKPLTDKQKKAVSFIKNEAQITARNLQIFSGNINFGSASKNVCAIMSENVNYHTLDYIIQTHKPDIVFSINIKNNTVLMKQCSYQSPIDCSIFIEKFCEGSGNNNMAFGNITPLFMEVTKNLNPI